MPDAGATPPLDDIDPGALLGSLGPARFINRELSWLDFNARVLELAADQTVPLLERAKFVAIFNQNLDEFFQVRWRGWPTRWRPGSGAPHRTG